MSVELTIAKRSLAGIVKDFDPSTKDISRGYHLKRLKDVIRKNEALIVDFVDSIFEYLRRDDCDVRLAALLVTDYFFQKSHAFRLQIVESLQDFLLCTAETDPLHYPLPESNAASKKQLKTEALKIVKLWCEKFSPAYAKLRIANDFLKSSKSFDYERVDATLRIERERAEEERLRKEAISERVSEKVRSILAENEPEIRRCLRETKSAIELLYPKFVSEEEGTEESDEKLGDRHLHGYYAGEEIKIVIKPSDILVKEDETNQALFESLRDCYKMLTCFHKAVTRWLQKLHKHMMDSNRDLLKTLVDLKNDIQGNIDKCKDLKADVSKKKRRAAVGDESESEEDDDDEFVDVEEKEGFEYDFKHDEEDDIPKHVLDQIARMQEKDKEVAEEPQPGPSGIKIVDEEKPCCSKDIRSAVPTVSYGLDLKYWDDMNAKPAELPKNVFDGMNFWKESDSDVLNDQASSYQVRVMTFVGNEDSGPKLTCRRRMKNGKLCPRMDRETCPFHGKIIPRDEQGFPMEENADAEAIEREKEREKKEEEEMVRDIEQVTGVSLTGKKPQKKKQEKPQADQTRDRLKKKLFDKKALKRVTETLEAMKQSKMQRIHAHNWSQGLTK